MHASRRLHLLLASALAATCAFAQAPRPAVSAAPAATTAAAASPEKTRAQYNAIFSHLDAGGDLMVVVNTDGVVEDLVDMVRGFAQAVPARGPGGANPFEQALGRVPGFLKSSGLYAIDGIGMSVVPRPDGLNDVKAFIYRDPAAASLPLWQGLVGGAPKRLATLDYLPPDTALVRAGTADPRQFWKLITDAVRQVGGPEAGQAFDAMVAEGGKSVGTNLNTVIASLDAEQFISLQLSTTQTVQLPSDNGGEGLTIPVPSLLAGCAVRDASLADTLQLVLQRQQIPVVRSTSGATTLYSCNVPVPLPFPVTPTFAVHRGMLLFGSTAEVVKQAIASAENPAGARGSAALQRALEGQPKLNNGFAFVDRRFAETLTKVQVHFMKQSAGAEGAQFLQEMMQRQQAGPMALVFVNEKDGVAIRGVSAQGGRQIVLGVAVMPIAMVAGVAIPSTMAARSAARSTAAGGRVNAQNSGCINNLRLLDHAKQQWAVEKNKADTDTPTAADLVKYFKTGRMPSCPQGGTYTLRSVGEAPTCSKPGHVLPE